MIYSCIDIGSDTIKIVVGRINDESLNILASVHTRSVGIKNGLIVDKELVEKSILLALDEVFKQTGFKIDKAIITVPFYDVDVNVYHGESYSDGEISGDDVITCFKSCVSTIDYAYEVVSVFPIDFTIDDVKKCYDPKGEMGHKLESRMLISTIPKANLYPILEILDKCHVEVIDLSFGPINDFYHVKENEDYLKNSGVLIDIGAHKTEIAIFNKGLLMKGCILPMGSRLVDNDISYIYHLDHGTSRKLKETLAMASSQYADSNDIVEYNSVDGEKIYINQLELSQVVEARIEDILKNVKKSLNNLTNREISYIIITGGITNMPGFDYLISNIFGDMACKINMNIMGVRNNVYTSCVGMIKYYYDKLKLRGIEYTMYDNIKEELNTNREMLNEELISNMKKYFENN